MGKSAKRSEQFLSVVSIATGRYLSYWHDLVRSFEDHSEFFDDIHWVLLTDQETLIDSKLRQLLGQNLTVKYVPHTKWPFPTLLRYKYISENKDCLLGENTLYLDADMKVVATISHSQISNFFDSDQMTFVQHPGFFRESSGYPVWNLREKTKDLVMTIRSGGIGSWETNRESQAFVPRSKRSKYFCGGIWGGPTIKVTEFTHSMDLRTGIDLDNGIIATFHDESHLNWYAANSICKIETPSWCFEPTYKNLSNLEPLIEAVNKNTLEPWVR